MFYRFVGEHRLVCLAHLFAQYLPFEPCDVGHISKNVGYFLFAFFEQRLANGLTVFLPASRQNQKCVIAVPRIPLIGVPLFHTSAGDVLRATRKTLLEFEAESIFAINEAHLLIPSPREAERSDNQIAITSLFLVDQIGCRSRSSSVVRITVIGNSLKLLTQLFGICTGSETQEGMPNVIAAMPHHDVSLRVL